MNPYRVTKYDPQKRNELGHYLDVEEWTEFFQVGDKVTLEEYEEVESAYIDSAIELVSKGGASELEVVGLEDHQGLSNLKNGAIFSIKDIAPILRSLLRGEFWCRLESKRGFIPIGWNFYMYVGTIEVNQSALINTTNRGLFVEEFVSPYQPENC